MKLKFLSLVTAISITTTPTVAKVSIEKPNSLLAQNLPSEEQYGNYLSPVHRSDRIKSLKGNSKQLPDFLTNRFEDIRDSREDRRDNREDLGDRFEDIRDSREDRRDNREDLGDRFEDIRDNREDRRDNREDLGDRQQTKLKLQNLENHINSLSREQAQNIIFQAICSSDLFS